MSVIRKTPYIEGVVSRLSADNLASLISAINSNTGVTSCDWSNVPEGVNAVLFKLSETDSKNGILINTDDDFCLICYHRFQDLLLIKLSSNHTYSKVDEYCDINELRRILASHSDSARAVIDPEDEDIVIYNEGLQVNNNGDVTVGRDLYVEDELVIESKEKFVDPDGNPIDFGGGGGNYLHKIVINNDLFEFCVIDTIQDAVTPENISTRYANFNLISFKPYWASYNKKLLLQLSFEGTQLNLKTLYRISDDGITPSSTTYQYSSISTITDTVTEL